MSRALVLLAAVGVIAIAPPVASQRVVDAELERIYEEYNSAGGRLSVDRLVTLDQQLRRLVPDYSWEGRPASSKGYREEFTAIGVHHAAFAPESLAYSGKLLSEAHRLNPTSHRSETLFSTIFSDESSLPSPVAAKAYLKEFPRGPFAIATHLTLAFFYSDLFNVLREEEAGATRDYKYDCYKTHIAPGPLAPQRRSAQAQAIEHYTAVRRLRPQLTEVAEWLDQFRRDPGFQWHFCAD